VDNHGAVTFTLGAVIFSVVSGSIFATLSAKGPNVKKLSKKGLN
jgi:hypothetical protein